MDSETDYVRSSRYDNSLAKLLLRYPDGCPDRISAQALGVTEEEFARLYEEAVQILKERLGASSDEE